MKLNINIKQSFLITIKKKKKDYIETLHKLRKYILNESLINQLIKEYNTYFSSTDKTPDKLAQQKKNEEYREVAKNKSE